VAVFGRNSNRGYYVCHAFSSATRRGRWSSPGVQVPTFQPYSSYYSTTTALTMKNKKGKTIAKQNLPSKVCVVCERPFTWRKKWEANWDEVTTCSKSCNAKRKQQHKQEKVQTTATPASSAAVVSMPKNTSGKYGASSSPFYEAAAVVSSSFPAPKIKDSTSPTTSTVATTNCNDDASSLSASSSQDGVEEDNICIPNTGTIIVSSDEEEQDDEDIVLDPKALKKLLRTQRKDSVKAQKQERRLKREGKTTPEVGQKQCDLCDKSVDMLIRCTMDVTQQYRMVCGKCWPSVSGGVTDGNLQTHPHYHYGGVWKNRNATQKKRIGDGRRRTKS